MHDLQHVIAQVRHDGRQRQVKCPAHDDKRPSLSVGVSDEGRVLLDCKAGCSFDEVIDAVGIDRASLRPPTNGHAQRVVAQTYDYKDAQGVLRYQVVRYAPKGFTQRRPESDTAADTCSSASARDEEFSALHEKTSEQITDLIRQASDPATQNALLRAKRELLEARRCDEEAALRAALDELDRERSRRRT